MRYSKSNKYKNEILKEIIKLLFNLDKKDNKLFRKLLSSVMFELYGNNYEKFVKDIKDNIKEIFNKNKEKNIDIFKNNNEYLEIIIKLIFIK